MSSFLLNSFQPFGGGVAGGGFAATRVALSTGTGSQNVTISGFGTPRGVLALMSNATADATAKNSLVFSGGAADGTRQWVTGTVSVDAQASSSTERQANLTSLLMDINGDPPVTEAEFSSFITDGISLNKTANANAGNLVTYMFFGGNVTNFYAGQLTSPLTVGTGKTKTGVGFRPDALILMNTSAPANPGAWNDTSATSSVTNLGFAARSSPITQCCLTRLDVAASATMDIRGAAMSSKCFANISGTAIGQTMEVTSFDSDGFTYTVSGGTINASIGFIALKTTAGSAKALFLDQPTATGNKSWTGVGFEPSAAFMLPSMVITADTYRDNAEVGPFGVSLITANEEFCNSWAAEDAAANSNTQSMTDDTAIHLTNHAGTDSHIASFVSFDADGITLNYTTTDGTARKMPALFIA